MLSYQLDMFREVNCNKDLQEKYILFVLGKINKYGTVY